MKKIVLKKIFYIDFIDVILIIYIEEIKTIFER